MKKMTRAAMLTGIILVGIFWAGCPLPDTGSVPVSEISAYTGADFSMNRYLTSAVDADLDMAAALIFASKRWPMAAGVYGSQAVDMLRALQEYGVVKDPGDGRYYIAAGTSRTSPRPGSGSSISS